MKIFKDRQSAGKLLAKRIKGDMSNWGDKGIVLGIPRGGVVVAKEIADELNLPLDIIVTRKIGHPNQKELAIGAVDPDGEVVLDQDLEIRNLKLEIEKEIKEIKRRENIYRPGRVSLQVKDKTILLVDDGIATGLTTLSAINYLKRHKAKKIILAVPVASKESVEKLKREVEMVVILEIPEYFQAVGAFYQEFEEVSDEEVIQLTT